MHKLSQMSLLTGSLQLLQQEVGVLVPVASSFKMPRNQHCKIACSGAVCQHFAGHVIASIPEWTLPRQLALCEF